MLNGIWDFLPNIAASNYSWGLSMTCKDVAEFLADYLDGTLPLRQRWIFKTHLMLCRDCRRYLRSYVATLRLSRSLAGETREWDPEVPQELFDAVMATLRKSTN